MIFAGKKDLILSNKRIDEIEEKIELIEFGHTMDLNRVILLFQELLEKLKEIREKSNGERTAREKSS